MELALNVVRAVVMTQLRIWITPYVRAAAEHILWSFVLPNLVRIYVGSLNAKILESVDTRHPSGALTDFLRGTRGFALIAGPIEEF
jgi:hypothetical protein